MFDKRALRIYITGAVIVWIGIIVATALMLSGEAFSPMMIVLSGGAFWFIVLVPAWLRTLINANADS
jgi:hypothetical protein